MAFKLKVESHHIYRLDIIIDCKWIEASMLWLAFNNYPPSEFIIRISENTDFQLIGLEIALFTKNILMTLCLKKFEYLKLGNLPFLPY